jgi:tetratricopeptide (TPR) repeat protein
MTSPKVCLNMIVKDEAAIIERCLRSVLPAVDRFVVCDTGSTDSTPEVIRSFFDRHGVAGEVHRIAFGNFESARNRALDLCRRSTLDFDYLLLLDADMELIVHDLDFRRHLDAHAYNVRQVNSISYFNTRLVRRDCPARYVGVTHEYLDVGPSPDRLSSIWFHDWACGSSRAEKLERDARLLTEGLRQSPGNPRYLFYLAQTCKDAGRFEEAIAWYERRVEAGGWAEEAWYALYMIAICHEQLGNAAAMMDYCLRAFDFRPSRAEPLLALARCFRKQRDFKACMMFAEMAEKLRYPEADSLFIEDSAYGVGVDEEISVAGFYCEDERQQAKGRAKSVALSTSRAADDTLREMALRNMFYYAHSAAELFPSFSTREIAIAVDSDFAALNPSVSIDPHGRSCVVRSVNYRVIDGIYRIFDPKQTIRTQNYFVTLDDGYEVITCQRMLDLAQDERALTDFVEGYEDCRLFRCRGRLWCTCTVRNRCSSGRCEIALLGLDAAGNVVEVHVIRDINPEMHQKNWAPLVRDDELYLIYGHDPTIVLHYDFDCHQARVAHFGLPGPCLRYFRGSSQAIRARDGWLYLVHEAAWIDERSRFYMHRFVTMSDDFRVTGFSEPFYFVQKGIEFCAGLGYDATRRQFIVSFGIDDCQARLAFVDEDEVFARIEPVAAKTSSIRAH